MASLFTTSGNSATVTFTRGYFFLLLLIIASLAGYIVYREIEIRSTLQLGEFYKNYVKGYELS